MKHIIKFKNIYLPFLKFFNCTHSSKILELKIVIQKLLESTQFFKFQIFQFPNSNPEARDLQII